MRQKACLSSTPQCALALARWLPGSGLARNPILVWRRRSRSCRKRLKSSLQKSTEDRMPRQAASVFFLSFFLLSSLLSLELSFVIVAVIIVYSTRKQSSSLSVACLLCLLACCNIPLPSCCCCNLLQRNSLQLLFFEFNSCFFSPPFLSWLSEFPRLL